MTDELVRDRLGAVLVARLNRPDSRNALTPELLRGISAAIVDAEADPEIRAVVLTGTGDRAFCAGMDLRAFAAGEQAGVGADEATRGFFRLIEGATTVPVVGAANGTAVAGGFELLLACDLIVASSEAEFGLPEVKRGLFPAGSGTFLGTRVALGIALEMALTGEPITAGRAYDLGLVNAVVRPDEVMETALARAERIAANGPLGVAAVKELVRLGVSDAARAGERLDEWRRVVFSSEDAKEGAMAFIEKRAPVWQGR
ncbi:MAG TPA: enoyl-CoA hydratase-related protein [Acidimicrobiales bacterium]|nr:enoyl-CoA hydratase-related protein [Acidimicrobiales bacterium]